LLKYAIPIQLNASNLLSKGDTLSSKNKKKKSVVSKLPSEFEQININAAGIDIGAQTHYVAVPKGRDPQGQDVRYFETFTTDLYALADWLTQCDIDTVAMESTGVYWIPLFDILEQKGFEVRLVNPRSIKHAPGRKSDVVDCQWIQQLHTYGLLTSAFRPDDQISVLRSYHRQRAMLVNHASTHIQHMQKALELMNIKLNNVISDITGVTGMKIIRSILSGERNPKKLALHRNPRCKKSVKEIAKSLHGNWRDEHLFALKQAVALYGFYQTQIEACDQKIQTQLSCFEDRSNGCELPPTGKSGGSGKKLTFDARKHLYRMTGVDLTRIVGLDTPTVLSIISEVGLDMNRWPTSKHFASWLSLSPGSKISGGKNFSSKTKPSANRAAHAFRMAAYSLHRSNTAIGAFLRRKKAQLGAPKAITATAHKIARIFYEMLKNRTEYKDLGVDYYQNRYKERTLRNLKRKAKIFGFELVNTKQEQSVMT
jgi:transposase